MIGNKLIILTTVNKKITSNPYCASTKPIVRPNSRWVWASPHENILVKQKCTVELEHWHSADFTESLDLVTEQHRLVTSQKHNQTWGTSHQGHHGHGPRCAPDLPGRGRWQDAGDSAQSSPALCGPMGCSPPGSSVHGSFQARILEWVVMPSSRGSSRPRDPGCISCSRGQRDTLDTTMCEVRQVVGAPQDRLEHGGGQRWPASEQSAERLPWLWSTSQVLGCDLDGGQQCFPWNNSGGSVSFVSFYCVCSLDFWKVKRQNNKKKPLCINIVMFGGDNDQKKLVLGDAGESYPYFELWSISDVWKNEGILWHRVYINQDCLM